MQNIINYSLAAWVIMFTWQCQHIEPGPSEQIPEVPVVDSSMLTIDFIMGKYAPQEREDFVRLDTPYSRIAGIYLHKESYDAFKAMYYAALEKDIVLEILSATRNFDYQKNIWERKWNGLTTLSDGSQANRIQDPSLRAQKILLYSSMPGSSRHHWGTDIDINDLNNEYFESGMGKNIYDWLSVHAPDFGFCQPYTEKNNNRPGYEEEKWHWSYVPIAGALTQFVRDSFRNELITGFDGAQAAQQLGIKENYMLGLSAECWDSISTDK